MRLQKRLSRKIGNKEYVKWIITIPPSIITKLGWKHGQKLEIEVYNANLIIKVGKEEDE